MVNSNINWPNSMLEFQDRAFIRRAIALELEFERAIARNRDLALFRRNAATWEMLLTALIATGAERVGVYDLVESVHSKGLGSSALLRFMRDRRDDGLFVFGPDPVKKSKHRISLRDDLAEAALRLLDKRNSELLRAFGDLVGQDTRSAEESSAVDGPNKTP